MKSTPVRCSSARMLRPSRPMMRPFMSSDGQLHDGDRRLGGVAGREPLHHDARGCCARGGRRRAWSPPRSGAASARQSWRIWSSSSLQQDAAWPARRSGPRRRSSSRTWRSRSVGELGSRWPRARARAASSSLRGARARLLARQQPLLERAPSRRGAASSRPRAAGARRGRGAPAPAPRGPARRRRHALREQQRGDHQAGREPQATTTAAITISISVSSPRRRRPRPRRESVSPSLGAADRAVPGTSGRTCRKAALRPPRQMAARCAVGSVCRTRWPGSGCARSECRLVAVTAEAAGFRLKSVDLLVFQASRPGLSLPGS